MKDLFDTLRYDHPKFFRSTVLFIIAMILFSVFMSLPDSTLFRAIGVTPVQQKISAMGSGLYWSTRAALNKEGSSEHVQLYGNVEGIDQQGGLVATLPDEGKYKRRTFRLANLQLVDLYRAAQEVGALRMENARFDIYGEENVVVWIRNTPLNVKLIESGIAQPAERPPSNIFDLAFATYYWRIARHGVQANFEIIR